MDNQPTTDLTEAERKFLAFALDLAADRMADRSDEFDADDETALEKLRGLAKVVGHATVLETTNAYEEQRLCGKDRGTSGLYYRPCARAAGHKEAYCRSADGRHLFLAAPPMDPVHILGIDVGPEPAEAQQDEPDHVCNSVWARGEMDEPLGYLICGVCGKPKSGARP